MDLHCATSFHGSNVCCPPLIFRKTEGITRRTKLDQKLISRMVEENKYLYRTVERALDVYLQGKTKKENLLKFATDIIIKTGGKVPRLMKRNRQVIICWFCQNRSIIPELEEIINAIKDEITIEGISEVLKSKNIAVPGNKNENKEYSTNDFDDDCDMEFDFYDDLPFL